MCGIDDIAVVVAAAFLSFLFDFHKNLWWDCLHNI
jgi:hypothetical protein